MAVYKRGNIWWYKFYFGNRLIRQSAKTHSKTRAKLAEAKYKRRLEDGFNGLTEDNRKERIRTLRDVAKSYSAAYALRHPKSVKFSNGCIEHLLKHMGSLMLIEITEQLVQTYKTTRLEEGAAGKTINEEVGELFRIMGESGEIVRLRLKRAKNLKLSQRSDVGRALTAEEEKRILAIAVPGKKNTSTKSPVIYPAIVLALNTGMRSAEMRQLRWGQFDFLKQILTVGESKTVAGTGRTIPLNTTLLRTFADYVCWYEEHVGKANADCFVFPGGKARHYDATKPITTLKTAWKNVLRKAKVKCRLHDTRHTLITKLAESGASDETIMAIAGHVSRRMLSRYAHIRTEAKRRALEAIATQHHIKTSDAVPEAAGHKNGHNREKSRTEATRRVSKQQTEKAPQVGLEPTTLRLTAGSNNYCLVLPGFASSCFLMLSCRK